MSVQEKLAGSSFLGKMYEKRHSPMGRWLSIGLVILGLILFIVSTIVIGASDADGLGSMIFIGAFVAIGLPTAMDLLFELAGYNSDSSGAAPLLEAAPSEGKVDL